MEDLGELGNSLQTGIYYGWAFLKDEVYQTVISVGWNPFYNNVKKTVEAHLLHQLEDFYGEKIKIYLIGFLRHERSFDSLGTYYGSVFINNLFLCFQMSLYRVYNLILPGVKRS